jgi:hypothetical protein
VLAQHLLVTAFRPAFFHRYASARLPCKRGY